MTSQLDSMRRKLEYVDRNVGKLKICLPCDQQRKRRLSMSIEQRMTLCEDELSSMKKSKGPREDKKKIEEINELLENVKKRYSSCEINLKTQRDSDIQDEDSKEVKSLDNLTKTPSIPQHSSPKKRPLSISFIPNHSLDQKEKEFEKRKVITPGMSWESPRHMDFAILDVHDYRRRSLRLARGDDSLSRSSRIFTQWDSVFDLYDDILNTTSNIQDLNHETLAIAHTASERLKEQSEKLRKIQSEHDTAGSSLSQSENLLTDMRRRIIGNMCTMFLCFFIVLCFIFLIILRILMSPIVANVLKQQ